MAAHDKFWIGEKRLDFGPNKGVWHRAIKIGLIWYEVDSKTLLSAITIKTDATDDKYERIYQVNLPISFSALHAARQEYEGTSYTLISTNCHFFVNSVIRRSGHISWEHIYHDMKGNYILKKG
jgi:hypothetical protein